MSRQDKRKRLCIGRAFAAFCFGIQNRRALCGIRLLWVYTVFDRSRSLETLMVIYPITRGIAAVSHSICYLLLVRKIKKVGVSVT